jgi:hypothetical protein
MFVYFNNGISNSEDHQLPFTNYKLTNYPNPFNPSTTIVFSLNKEITESTDLSIYNTKGQKIKDMSLSLCHPEFIEGRGGNNYSVTWDGTDQNNQPVSSGIYFYKLRIDEENIKSKKMILLK